MYRNILIPTDGSDLAGKALKHGIALAKSIGTKTTFLTVTPQFHIFTTDTQMIEDTPAQYKTRIAAAAAKTLRAAADAAGAAGVGFDTVQLRGRASLPGDHRYRWIERLESHRHGLAWAARHRGARARQ